MADNKTLRERFSDLIMQELKAEAKHNKRLADAMQSKNKSEKQCIDYVLEKVQDYNGVPTDEHIILDAMNYYMYDSSKPKREHTACIKNVTTEASVPSSQDEGIDDLDWDEIDDLDWD